MEGHHININTAEAIYSNGDKILPNQKPTLVTFIIGFPKIFSGLHHRRRMKIIMKLSDHPLDHLDYLDHPKVVQSPRI